MAKFFFDLYMCCELRIDLWETGGVILSISYLEVNAGSGYALRSCYDLRNCYNLGRLS